MLIWETKKEVALSGPLKPRGASAACATLTLTEIVHVHTKNLHKAYHSSYIIINPHMSKKLNNPIGYDRLLVQVHGL